MKKKLLIVAVFGITILLLSTAKNVNASLEKIQSTILFIKEVAEDKVKARSTSKSVDFLQINSTHPETAEETRNDELLAGNYTNQNIAQKQESSLIQWDFIGPDNVGGRTRAILIDKTNPNLIIAGGVSGGLWRSFDGGLNWQEHPQNQTLPCLIISCITQAANGHIYMGTGEKIWNSVPTGNGNTGFAGCGMFKSTDGGNTFTALESTTPISNSSSHQWAYIIDITTHPDNPNWVYAATESSFFMSKDGGTTWSNPVGITPSTGSVWSVAAASNGTIHVLIGSQYFKAADGETFVLKSGTGLGDFPNIANMKKIAVSPTNPNYLYAITTKASPEYGCLSQVLKSTDGGEIWYEIGVGNINSFDSLYDGSDCMGWYNLCLTVDPSNQDRIFFGGVDLWTWSESDNWIPVSNGLPASADSPYYIHSNIHTLVFHPVNANTLYIGSSGGVSRTVNAGEFAPTFTTLNHNYNVTQFYSIAANNLGRVLGGTQDNGTQFANYSGETIWSTTQVISGHCGHVDFSNINPNIAFGANVNGRLLRSSNGGNSFDIGFLDEYIDCEPLINSQCYGDNMVDQSPEYITPTHLWEDTNTGLALFATGNGTGKIWITVQALNVGIVPHWYNIGQFSGSGLGRTVTAITIGRDISGKVMVVAGSADGRVLILRNFIVDETASPLQIAQLSQVTKKEITSNTVTGGLDIGRYITSVSIDPYSPVSLIVTMGNYQRNIYVFRTLNAIVTNPVFISIQGTGDSALPPMPVYDLVIDRFDPNRLIAATEKGVWMCEIVQVGANVYTYIWSEQNDGIGRVPVFQIRQEQYSPFSEEGCYLLYIATHGKGMFRSSSLTFPTCPELIFNNIDDINGGSTTSSELAVQVLPNPLVNNGVIKLNIFKPSKQATVSIFNTQGKLVYRQSVSGEAGTQSLNIRTDNYPSGMYIVEFENGRNKTTAKFVVK